LWVEKGLHIQAGRFDVPFGNDWLFFASKDSVSISRPLTTELVMEGGYNDTGFRVLGNNGSVNFNAFLLHGFSSGRLVGGRVGLTPFSDPFSLKFAQEPKRGEVGLSYFYDASSGWKKNEVGWAADGEMHWDDLSGRFEYMFRKKYPALDGSTESTVLRGWHFTSEYALGETVAWPTTLFARYERVIVRPAEIASPDAAAGDDRDIRVAAGVSSVFGETLQLKFEMQHYRAATPSTREMPGFGRRIFWFTQMVLML
jgi:hypothetical protein